MAQNIGGQTVGSVTVPLMILSDPSSAANLQNVVAPADALNLTGNFAALMANVAELQNSGGTFDKQRSAVGTTGIPAVNTEGTKATYSAGVVAFTPAATPTDFAQLVGSSSKILRVTRINISGISTGVASIDIQLIKRSTATTGGTPTAATIVSHDSNDGSSGATFNSFAANPTVGTIVGVVRVAKLNLAATGSAGQIEWTFTTRNGKGIVLRNANEQLALNGNGGALPAGTNMDFDIEFTAE